MGLLGVTSPTHGARAGGIKRSHEGIAAPWALNKSKKIHWEGKKNNFSGMKDEACVGAKRQR